MLVTHGEAPISEFDYKGDNCEMTKQERKKRKLPKANSVKNQTCSVITGKFPCPSLAIESQ